LHDSPWRRNAGSIAALASTVAVPLGLALAARALMGPDDSWTVNLASQLGTAALFWAWQAASPPYGKGEGPAAQTPAVAAAVLCAFFAAQTAAGHGQPDVAGAAAWASVAIGAPLAEELCFRGPVLRLIAERSGRIVAVVATSALFALVHSRDAVGTLWTFVAGAAFAAVSLRHGVAASMACHCAFNTVSQGLAASPLLWAASPAVSAASSVTGILILAAPSVPALIMKGGGHGLRRDT
jgi:membrane protease YdiL (CAAX protease family)